MKFRLLTILFLITTAYVFPQAEYVPYNHSVYDFLQRMDAKGFISNYNSFERPQTRAKISEFLKQLKEHYSELNKVDKQILEDYRSEFELELYGTQNNATSVLGSPDYNFFSPKEKYFYKIVDSSKFTLFINVTGDMESILNRDNDSKLTKSAAFTRWGGTIRGTILNKFGYYMKATNGRFWGQRSISRSINELKFNYKFNANPNEVTATDYFDNTEGYFTLDYDLIKFKIGRDYKQIGYGQYKTILDVNTPQFDYVSFDFNYKIFSFSYFHGKLLGQSSVRSDSIQGEINSVDSKYIGYHRLGFNFSKDFTLGIGEMIVYANRPIDLSYLNPFNFYKGTEHANQDRDNSFLFFDFSNNSIQGLKLFGSVLIDDIDFGKIGSGWYGNQLAYNFYLFSSNLYDIAPIDLKFQYLRIEPFVYTHRIFDNNYSNLGYSLVSPIKPNSELFYLGLSYHPYYRLGINLDLTYSIHGANQVNEQGTIVKNFGGDPNVGHRPFDQESVFFLDGVHEYLRSIAFSAVFEPIRNYFVSGKLVFENSDFGNSPGNYVAAFALLNLRL
ncbi:MAG: capsule assembly Wzi family protein [Bacteroidota bacterium]|nr:capsule assembly Wzi family protein [Bacteroidota bacterium]